MVVFRKKRWGCDYRGVCGDIFGVYKELLLSWVLYSFLFYGYVVNYFLIYIFFCIYVIIFFLKKKKDLNGKIYILLI